MFEVGVSPCMRDSGHRFTLCYIPGRPVCCASSIPFAPLRLITEQHCSLNIYDFPAVFNEIRNTFSSLKGTRNRFAPLHISEIRNRFFLFDRNQESFFSLFGRDQEYLFLFRQGSGIACFLFDRDQCPNF
jgi:hypothetical protein